MLSPAIKTAAKSVIKQIAFTTRLHRFMFNVYDFMYSPSELCYLTRCLSQVDGVPGSVVEAGCAYGATTVWLNQYMDEQQIDRSYYALDTFAGFVAEQVLYERERRDKSAAVEQTIRSTFSDNRQDWFDKTMAMHGITRVRSVCCDVSRFDFATTAPIAFCLLDVDLYLPIQAALPRIYDALSPGGLLVVDDCWPNEKWDGALQAYLEFCQQHDLEPQIVGRKLGVIAKRKADCRSDHPPQRPGS
jgi:SAM-dependent methyltransferase